MCIVDSLAIDTRRCAGLQSIDAEWTSAQALGQRFRRWIAGTATGITGITNVNLAVEEGTYGQYHVRCEEAQSHLRNHAFDGIALFDQIDHGLLKYRQARPVFQHFANRDSIQLAIGLGTRRTHRRALAPVQNSKLDTGPVRGQRHRTAERIDFLDQVALADAADGRITGHLPEGLDAVRQ